MSMSAALWTTFFTSMLPIWELKGAILTGAAMGIPTWTLYLVALLGSSIPVFFIIFLIEKVIHWMSGSKVKFFNNFSNWLLKKVDKHKGKIEKYGYLGVFIFVAIPLPGTGVWTGSLIASVLGLKPLKALPLIILGNAVAGLLMILFSGIFFPNVALWA
ncbi:COG2426 family protein [Christensenella hongkongensis]|uniref:COG2426 family protein n=1 Tax=Christensenella hongkongensis TaxID=270498 RepID=UPI0009E788FB|nr:small multi-drug export protein [Christensenella hongkongensis]